MMRKGKARTDFLFKIPRRSDICSHLLISIVTRENLSCLLFILIKIRALLLRMNAGTNQKPN